MDSVWLELKENYIKKLELLQSILNITQRQEELIEKDDMDAFERNLERRQKLMEKVDALDLSRDQILKLLILKNKHDKAAEEITDVKLLKDRIQETLSEITRLNTCTQKSAQDKLEEYRKKVKETQQAKKCLHSYSGAYPVDGIHFDTKK
jgi:hypothetical protein